MWEPDAAAPFAFALGVGREVWPYAQRESPSGGVCVATLSQPIEPIPLGISSIGPLSLMTTELVEVMTNSVSANHSVDFAMV